MFNPRDYVTSSSYPKLAARMVLSEHDTTKIWRLETTIIRPTETFFNSTRVITSGKRSDELNLKVGGKKTSDHLYRNECAACDFVILGADQYKVFLWIKTHLPYAFGQLKYYPTKGFVHVSLPSYRHQYVVLDRR